jgi:CheY-like chemotaxis protein
VNDKRRAVAHLALDKPVQADEGPRKRSGVRRKNQPRLEEGLVLIVDDDAMMREALHRMVSRRYRTIQAPDAATAIALCMRERPDVVVSDYDMPVVTGRRLAELRGLARGASAPAILIVPGGDTDRAIGPGVVRVLQKPTGLAVLLDAVAETRAARRESGGG